MSSLRHLLEQALYSPSFWHSRAAARSLEHLRPPAEFLQGSLAEALGHADERIRRRAVCLLGIVRLPTATALPLLRRALADGAWPVRRAAARELAAREGEAASALADLLDTLNDEVSGVREAAVEAIGTLAAATRSGGVEASTALLSRLSDADEAVREVAARALGRLPVDPAQALPALAAALSDEAAAVRELVVRLLGQIGAEAQRFESALLGLLNDPASAVRREVVATLGRVGTEQALPVMIRLLEGDLRDEAARALAELGGRLPCLEERLLSAFRSGNSAVRVGALRALACLDSPAALAECRRRCREADLGERRRAVRALGWFGARAAEVLPDLEIALRDSQAKVRRAAADGLAALGGRAARALPGLLRRLYDCDARVRSACAASVAKILPELPAIQQPWLGVLADPGHGPGHNLRQALARPELPEGVGAAFLATCRRRAAWHAAHAGESSFPSERPSSLWLAARAAARQAGCKAARESLPPGQSGAGAARRAEHAWQIGCLWSLLFPVC